MPKRNWRGRGGGGGGGGRGRGQHFDGRDEKRSRADGGEAAGGAADASLQLKDEEGWIRTAADGGPPDVSPAYVSYYQSLGIVAEGEWDAFMASWQDPLPVTFRVNPLSPDAAATSARLRSHPAWSVAYTMEDGRVLPLSTA